jgi:WD40 repeat protein
VTADSDGSVDLWQAGGSYAEITLAPTTRVHGKQHQSASAVIQVKGGLPVYAAFSPDGARIVVLNSDGGAEVFSAKNGQQLQALSPVGDSLFTVALFSPDGRQILTGDDDGQVEVWNAATGKYGGVLGAVGPGIKDVQFDNSGKYFVTASDAGAIAIWSADDQLVSSFRACPSPSSASLSPGGRYVAVACSGGLVPVYSAAGQELAVIADPGIASSAAFSPDGQSIITAFGLGQTGGVRIWSSELANTSLPMLERLARQRIVGTLTPDQVNAALAGPGGQIGTP